MKVFIHLLYLLFTVISSCKKVETYPETSVTIKGKVWDVSTNSPVGDVLVFIFSSHCENFVCYNGSSFGEAKSNKEGVFEIPITYDGKGGLHLGGGVPENQRQFFACGGSLGEVWLGSKPGNVLELRRSSITKLKLDIEDFPHGPVRIQGSGAEDYGSCDVTQPQTIGGKTIDTVLYFKGYANSKTQISFNTTNISGDSTFYGSEKFGLGTYADTVDQYLSISRSDFLYF